MQTALTNGRVMTDRGAIAERAVLVEDGRIAGVVRPLDVPPMRPATIWPAGCCCRASSTPR